MKEASCIFLLVLTTFFSAASTYDVFEENGKVGLRDEQGKVIIPARYDALGWSDGTVSVVDNVTGYKLNGRWGLISLSNKLVTGTVYEEILRGEGSLLVARKQSNLSLRLTAGCITTTGKEAIAFQYDGLKLYTLRAVVFTKIGNQFRYGLVDLENKTLIPQQYQNIYPIGGLRFAVENFDNKIAIFSDSGKQLTAFSIDKIAPFTKNYATIYQDGKQGVISRDGHIKVEPVHHAVAILEDGAVKVRDADTWLFVNGSNTLIRKTAADKIEPIGKNLLRVTTGSFVRLTDLQLKPLSPDFDAMSDFVNNKAVVVARRKCGLLARSGAVLIQPAYDTVALDKHRVLADKRQGALHQWTLLDTLGNRLSAKAYDHMEAFTANYFSVRQRGFAGALTLDGKEAIGCTYDSLLQTRDNLVVVKFRGQYGIINLNEEWIVTPRPNKLFLIGHDRFIERTSKTQFLRAMNGSVIYFTDNRLQIFDDYLYEFLPSGTRWKIDMDGRIVDRQEQPAEPIEKIFAESEGLRGILKNGKYGFIDDRARLRIANRYEGIHLFSEGLAGAKIRGRWGFINHQDQIAIQPVYEEVSAFRNGYALVKQREGYGLIDKTGRLVLPARYEDVRTLPTGNLLIKINGQEGLADGAGKILVQPRYHHVVDAGNGFVIVERDGKFGVVTTQSVSTVPLVYDAIVYDHFNHFFLAQQRAPWVEAKFQ